MTAPSGAVEAGRARIESAEEAFASFEARFGIEAGVEVLERITDAHFKKGGPGITEFEAYAHNACNHTLSGTIEHAGERFSFVIESGDRNGTVIREWGPEGDIEPFVPEAPTLYTFVPKPAGISPSLFRVFLLWQKQEWFKDAVRSYNYDRHFAPGVKTERHYRDLAEKRGLRIVDEAEAERIITKARAALSAVAAAEGGDRGQA